MANSNGTKRRKFNETHPWLKFSVDLQRAPFAVWMDLGAIQSKCEHVAHTLLPPEVARGLYTMYLAKGAWATTAIEGNTLSEQQVLERVRTRKTLPPSQEYQGREVDNIVDACNEIAERIVKGDECLLTVDGIKQFNARILKDLPLDEGVIPGQIPQFEVVVARYKGAPREDCELLLEKLCAWINEIKPPREDQRIAFGVIRAVMAHLYLAWIHPFGDGNGRTARLVEFQILLGAGVPSIAAHLLSNHYNTTRAAYYLELQRTSASGGEVLPFLAYAIQGMRDGLDAQIKQIRDHLWTVAWKDYVYEHFRELTSAAAHRQKEIALALGSRLARYVPLAKIPSLNVELARAYAGKTAKTTSRDIDALLKMGFIVKRNRQIRARRELLQMLLPGRRDEKKRH